MGLLSTLFSDKPSCCLKLETPIYRKFPTVIGGSSNANREMLLASGMPLECLTRVEGAMKRKPRSLIRLLLAKPKDLFATCSL